MTYTFLELTQLLLSSMDGDEVNSWDDTVESTSVGHLIKSVFYDCCTELRVPQQHTLLELTASGSTSRPVLMTIPSNVCRIDWIKYNNKASGDTYADYQEVCFLPFAEFLDRQTSLRNHTSNVAEMTFTNNSQSFEVMHETNKHPQWFTTTNDNQLIFDSYDSTLDSTLQASKTMAYGWVYPTFTMSDNFTPPLEPAQFSFFVNKAKARAFNEIKQVANDEAASEARRQRRYLQNNSQVTPTLTPLQTLPRYGRK